LKTASRDEKEALGVHVEVHPAHDEHYEIPLGGADGERAAAGEKDARCEDLLLDITEELSHLEWWTALL
jgi:Mn-containing catalase